jgi:signal peptidase I
MKRESVSTDVLDRIYVLLLHAYPKEFRKRFGAEMRQVFRDRWQAVSAAPGLASPMCFFFQVAKDWMVTSSKERMAHMRMAFPGNRLSRAARGVSVAVLAVIVGLLVSSAFLQAYVISALSMDRSLQVGDHILVNKHGPNTQLATGDLVTFHYPEDRRQTFVKRVIGLPGDHIRLIDKQVFRNGRRLVEPYVLHRTQVTDTYRDDFPDGPSTNATPRGRDMLLHHATGGEIVVPAESLFVLGDNRDNSLDSRYWGFVPRQDVIGKPVLVYWSYDSGSEKTPFGGLPEHFFTRTRWNRTLHFLGAAPPEELER